MIKVHSAFWFCMSPEFIRHQLEASEAALGTQPDVVLLHNPEFFLTVARSAGVSPPPHDEFYASLRKCVPLKSSKGSQCANPETEPVWWDSSSDLW